MKLTVFKKDGKNSSSKVELSDSVFAIEPNETVLYEDVRRILASRRQGTAKTKERGEVRGGGRKAYKQKGTGMARRGSIRSPLLKGGGTVFGPKPRSYNIRLTKQAKRLARKSALSLKASEDAIKVVEDFSIETPKTKEIFNLLTTLDLAGKKVMIITPETNHGIFISARNIPGVSVIEAHKPNTYDIMNADALVFLKSAVDVLQGTFESRNEEEAA